MVYVLNKEGKPLMPTERCGWVAYALKHGEAKVERCEPFTIMLLRDSTDYLQEVTLGVDVGANHIGLSASTKAKELCSAQVELRDDVSELLTSRREKRRARRGRKHNWYRPARWANRANEKGNAALPPSIRHKADSHIRAIQFVCKMLPVVRIRLEIGKFDVQKIKNPDIEGVEYQRGPQMGWKNLKAYARWRDGEKCRICGKTSFKDKAKLDVHHIIQVAYGGTNVPENVVTLCHECHEAHHNNLRRIKFKRPPQHKKEAHMNAMKDYLCDEVHGLYGERFDGVTYGYITAQARREHGIEKSHANDAFCIAGNFEAKRNEYNRYTHRFVRRHNRCLHKDTIMKGGIRKANQCPREVFGYRKNDVVGYKGKHWFVHSRRTRGYFLLTNFDKTEKAEVSHRKIRLINRTGTILTERRTRNSSQP